VTRGKRHAPVEHRDNITPRRSAPYFTSEWCHTDRPCWCPAGNGRQPFFDGARVLLKGLDLMNLPGWPILVVGVAMGDLVMARDSQCVYNTSMADWKWCTALLLFVAASISLYAGLVWAFLT
jgi:hypothetical protein